MMGRVKRLILSKSGREVRLEPDTSFVRYMQEKVEQTPQWTVEQLVEQAGGWERVYLVFVDILKGFCEQGALSSLRVQEMVEPVERLTQRCLDQGLPTGHLLFLQDRHPEDAVEFDAFAPHCIAGSEEAEVVEALRRFQELQEARIFYKNATNGLFGKDAHGELFHQFLERRFAQGPCTFVLVGDCTDLCIYQNAMGIRLLANEQNADVQVIVPRSHVRTYDLPVNEAERLQVLAHDAETMEVMFLYHMQLNGIRVLHTLS